MVWAIHQESRPERRLIVNSLLPRNLVMEDYRQPGSDPKIGSFCHDLRLDGDSDWRLANVAELQGIDDKSSDAPGLAGPTKKLRTFTWDVKETCS
jgi:hypothetical protein